MRFFNPGGVKSNNTIFSCDEFTDNLRYPFGFTPTNLPAYCDGCGETFTAEHGLNCKKGGLVMARYDDATDEFESLAMLAFFPTAVLTNLG
jgi:hypothetical protein